MAQIEGVWFAKKRRSPWEVWTKERKAEVCGRWDIIWRRISGGMVVKDGEVGGVLRDGKDVGGDSRC